MTEPGDTKSAAPETEPQAEEDFTAPPRWPAAPAGTGSKLGRQRKGRSRFVAALLSIPGMSALLAAPAPQPDLPANRRSRLLAAFLSFIWPGLGQLYARRRISALIFGVPVLVAALWLVLQLTNGLDYFVASFLIDSFALTFVIGGLVFGVWRVASMIHAYATTGPRRRPGRRDSGVLAVLLLIVVVVSAEIVNYSWSTYRFDVDVPNNVLVQSQPTGGAPFVPVVTPVPTPGWTPPAIYAVPSATPGATPTPPPSHRLTILLTGMDWTTGRDHALNDAIMLVSLDTKTNKVSMISVPRDTAYFDFYYGGIAGPNTKINSLVTLWSQGKLTAPDPPLTAFAKEVGFLVGVKVDYYAAINMVGFTDLVDRLGGICIYNAKAINDPSTGTFIGSGNVCLDGATTMLYVRSRHNGGSDYVRAGRQQQVLLAVAHKMATARGLSVLPSLLSMAATMIQTNFPLKTVRDYVSIVQHLGDGDVTQCVLGPPYNYHPDSALTKGAWTSRLKLSRVAQLSVYTYGSDSRYYGMEGIVPAACGKSA